MGAGGSRTGVGADTPRSPCSTTPSGLQVRADERLQRFLHLSAVESVLARWNRRGDRQRKINILIHIGLKRLTFGNFHIMAVLQ